MDSGKVESHIQPPEFMMSYFVVLEQKHHMRYGYFFTSWKQLKDVDFQFRSGWSVSKLLVCHIESGYEYRLEATKEKYVITATPLNPTMENYHYYADNDRIVRREKGRAASKESGVFDDVRWRSYNPHNSGRTYDSNDSGR
jgi:hypothetical protein